MIKTSLADVVPLGVWLHVLGHIVVLDNPLDALRMGGRHVRPKAVSIGVLMHNQAIFKSAFDKSLELFKLGESIIGLML